MRAANGGFVSLADALRAQPSAAPTLPTITLESVLEKPEPKLLEFEPMPLESEPAKSDPALLEVESAALPIEPAMSALTVSPAPVPLLDYQPDDLQRLDLVREIRLFRAALADAFEGTVHLLVGKLARDVVARELRLEGVDIGALARGLLVEWEAEEPLRLRVAAGAADIACPVPVVVDPTLEIGDAVLECRSSEIDARLNVRLAAVLAAVRP